MFSYQTLFDFRKSDVLCLSLFTKATPNICKNARHYEKGNVIRQKKCKQLFDDIMMNTDYGLVIRKCRARRRILKFQLYLSVTFYISLLKQAKTEIFQILFPKNTFWAIHFIAHASLPFPGTPGINSENFLPRTSTFLSDLQFYASTTEITDQLYMYLV